MVIRFVVIGLEVGAISTTLGLAWSIEPLVGLVGLGFAVIWATKKGRQV